MGKRAGFWIRVAATGIDLVVAVAILLAAGVVYATVSLMTDNDQLASAAMAVTVYVMLLLYTSCEIWFAGTPGKLITGLRIRQSDGTPSGRWRLFLRWQTKHYGELCALVFALSGLLVFDLLAGFVNTCVLIGCMFAANDDKLAWHDEWAGTAVYWKRSLVPFTGAPPPPPLLPALDVG